MTTFSAKTASLAEIVKDQKRPGHQPLHELFARTVNRLIRSQVQIRPNGEVVRVPSRHAMKQAGKAGSGWRVNPETGDVVRLHTSTIEKVQ